MSITGYEWQVWDTAQDFTGGSAATLEAAKTLALTHMAGTVPSLYGAVQEVRSDGTTKVVWFQGSAPLTVPMDWRPSFSLPSKWAIGGALLGAAALVGTGLFFLTRDAH